MSLRILMLLPLLLTTLLGGCAEPPYTSIDNNQLKALLEQGVPIYDVRRPEEWRQTGVVAGSRKLTFVDAAGRLQADFMPRFTQEARPDQPVIIICRTGNRTAALGHILAEKLGYTKIYNVRDGITRWISDDNPVVKN